MPNIDLVREVKRQKRTLKSILSVQSESEKEYMMQQSILDRLQNIKSSLTEKEQKNFVVDFYEGNIFVTKGVLSKKEKYPCVVSHTDTVHDIINSYSIEEKDGWFYAMDNDKLEQVGTGGDDKVGIFITLEMIRAKKKIKAAFFAEEEIGLVGSTRAPSVFFKDCGFALQCDRKGNGDFVDEIGGTELYGSNFSKTIGPILKRYEYKETSGGSTDVVSIKEKVDICVANMSCGYYRPHSADEVVHIDSVINCRDMVSDLIDKLGNKLWKHKYTKQYSSYGYSGNYWSTMWGGSNTKRDTKPANTYVSEKKNGITTYSPAEENDDSLDNYACPHCKSDDSLMHMGGDYSYWCTQCCKHIESENLIPRYEIPHLSKAKGDTYCEKCGNSGDKLVYHKNIDDHFCPTCNIFLIPSKKQSWDWDWNDGALY